MHEIHKENKCDIEVNKSAFCIVFIRSSPAIRWKFISKKKFFLSEGA